MEFVAVLSLTLLFVLPLGFYNVMALSVAEDEAVGLQEQRIQFPRSSADFHSPANRG